MFKQVVYHNIDDWARAVLSKYPKDHASVVARFRTAADDARKNADSWAITAKNQPEFEFYAGVKEQTAVSMEREATALEHAARKQRELLLMVQGPSSSVPHHPSGLYGGSRRRNKTSNNSKKRSNKSHRRK
jgi:hypothetical protein